LAYKLTKKLEKISGRYTGKACDCSVGRKQTNIMHIFTTSLKCLTKIQNSPDLRNEIAPPVGIHPSGSHLVVYIEQDSESILIVRVRHFRENWQS
jgi:hypothetical protein